MNQSKLSEEEVKMLLEQNKEYKDLGELNSYSQDELHDMAKKYNLSLINSQLYGKPKQKPQKLTIPVSEDSQKLEGKIEAHLFKQERDLLGDVMYTIFFPSENYAFQKYIPDCHYGNTTYIAGDNQEFIESDLKPLIGKKPEYQGKFYFSKEEFNKLKVRAEKYMEAREFEKFIDDLINENFKK